MPSPELYVNDKPSQQEKQDTLRNRWNSLNKGKLNTKDQEVTHEAAKTMTIEEEEEDSSKLISDSSSSTNVRNQMSPSKLDKVDHSFLKNLGTDVDFRYDFGADTIWKSR